MDPLYEFLRSLKLKPQPITKQVETDNLHKIIELCKFNKYRDNQVWIAEDEEEDFVLVNRLKKAHFVFLIEENILVHIMQ